MIHRVVRGHDPVWSYLWSNFVSVKDGHYIASEYRPGSGPAYFAGKVLVDNDGSTEVAANKWAKVLTFSYVKEVILKGKNADEEEGIAQIGSWFQNEFKAILSNEQPAKIVFDELNTETLEFYTAFFNVLAATSDPTVVAYRPNFGLYILTGPKVDYGRLKTALTPALRCGVDLFPELYFKHSEYCGWVKKEGQTKADAKMQGLIKGTKTLRHIEYLIDLKVDLIKKGVASASKSGIYPVVTVGLPHLDLKNQQWRFIARIMHNFTSLGEKFFNSFHYNAQNPSFGSYKWTINAMGIINIPDEGTKNWNAWRQLLIDNEEDKQSDLTQADFDRTQDEGKKRAEIFIEAWNYYSSLKLKEIEKSKGKIAPLRTIPVPDCAQNEFSSAVTGNIRNSDSRYVGTPVPQRQKSKPQDSDLIFKGVKVHAYLAKIIVPFNTVRSKKQQDKFNAQLNDGTSQFLQTTWKNEDITSNPSNAKYGRFDLWINEVNYGFSVGGPRAASKFYSRNYTQSFQLTPVSVTGICYNENEYDDLGDFIREGQIALAQEPKNVFRLNIPEAKIDVIGAVGLFNAGFKSNNQGVPVAPQFKFDFIIFKDLKDARQTMGATAKTVIANFNEDPYWVRTFKDYQKDYLVGGLLDEIHTAPQRPEIGSGTARAGSTSLTDGLASAGTVAARAAVNSANAVGDFAKSVIDIAEGLFG